MVALGDPLSSLFQHKDQRSVGAQPCLSLPSRGMRGHISEYFWAAIKGEGLHPLCWVVKDQQGGCLEPFTHGLHGIGQPVATAIVSRVSLYPGFFFPGHCRLQLLQFLSSSEVGIPVIPAS